MTDAEQGAKLHRVPLSHCMWWLTSHDSHNELYEGHALLLKLWADRCRSRSPKRPIGQNTWISWTQHCTNCTASWSIYSSSSSKTLQYCVCKELLAIWKKAILLRIGTVLRNCDRSLGVCHAQIIKGYRGLIKHTCISWDINQYLVENCKYHTKIWSCLLCVQALVHR